MDLPVPPVDALAHPTRARLFTLLGELRRPAGTDELAALAKLHPNGVRVHLGRLQAAGLLERERIPQARGRPRDMWTIAPEAQLAAFVPGEDPRRAGCLIELGGALTHEAGATPTRPSRRTPPPTRPARPTSTRARSS